MGKIDFYGIDLSPYCRVAKITACALGLELNQIETNPMKGDTKKPEFLAINPAHCIPTIKDGDFILWESRPVSSYFAHKYGGSTGLYPADAETRALCEKMIHFDVGTLWYRFMKYAMPVIFKDQEPDPELRANIDDALKLFDSMLEGHDFVVGNKTTYADHSLIVSVTSMEASGIDMSKFKNIQAYIARCKEWPYYKDGQKGLEEFGAFFKSKLVR